MDTRFNQNTRVVAVVACALSALALTMAVLFTATEPQAERGLTRVVVVPSARGRGDCERIERPTQPLKEGARYALEYRGVDRGCVIYRLSPIFGRDP